MAANDQLYKLIENFCTTEQVKALLRDGKRRDEKDVRVSAENKGDLIQRNLRGKQFQSNRCFHCCAMRKKMDANISNFSKFLGNLPRR
jgi:hypothetical protein